MTDPVAAYLASMSATPTRGRNSARHAAAYSLRIFARVFSSTPEDLAWEKVDAALLEYARRVLAERYARATVTQAIGAAKGVLRCLRPLTTQEHVALRTRDAQRIERSRRMWRTPLRARKAMEQGGEFSRSAWDRTGDPNTLLRFVRATVARHMGPTCAALIDSLGDGTEIAGPLKAVARQAAEIYREVRS